MRISIPEYGVSARAHVALPDGAGLTKASEKRSVLDRSAGPRRSRASGTSSACCCHMSCNIKPETRTRAPASPSASGRTPRAPCPPRPMRRPATRAAPSLVQPLAWTRGPRARRTNEERQQLIFPSGRPAAEIPCARAGGCAWPTHVRVAQRLVRPVEREGAIVLDHAEQERFLVLEVMVDRPFGHAGGLGDIVEAGVAISLQRDRGARPRAAPACGLRGRRSRRTAFDALMARPRKGSP